MGCLVLGKVRIDIQKVEERRDRRNGTMKWCSMQSKGEECMESYIMNGLQAKDDT